LKVAEEALVLPTGSAVGTTDIDIVTNLIRLQFGGHASASHAKRHVRPALRDPCQMGRMPGWR